MEVDFDTWKANKNVGDTVFIDTNDFKSLRNLLTRLNQKEFTQIILRGDNSFLIIGGGNTEAV